MGVRHRWVSAWGVVLVTFIVGVPSASANLVEEVVETANSVVEAATSPLPNALPPVSGPAPAVPQGVPQIPVSQAPDNPPEAVPTPVPSSRTAPAPSGGATAVASPDAGPRSASPATDVDADDVGIVASAPREAAGADKPARSVEGPGGGKPPAVAVEPAEAAGPQRGSTHLWQAVETAGRSAPPSDSPAPFSFDPVSIGGGMGFLLTLVTSVLAFVGLVALARLVVGDEFRSTLRWRH